MGRVGAVARQTISEALRMKVAVIFVVVLIILIAALPFSIRGDGTANGAVRTFLSYSLWSVGFLLSLLTIFMSQSLSLDIATHRIFTVVSKPIPRWQYFIGKWLGIVLFDLALLLFAGLAIYGMAHYIPTRFDMTQDDRQTLQNEVFTARGSSKVIRPDLAEAVDLRFQQLRDEGRFSESERINEEEVKRRLGMEMMKKWRTIMLGMSRTFSFERVLASRDPADLFQVRFCQGAAVYPPDQIIRTVWYIGDRSKGAQGYRVDRRDVLDRFHRIAVPGDAIAADQTVRAILVNVNPFEGEPEYNTVIVFRSDELPQVLFKVGSFEFNFVRLLCLMLFKLMFLAGLGLFAASLFSFPVACLISLTIYAMSAGRSFIQESLGFIGSSGGDDFWRQLFSPFMEMVLHALPNLGKFSALNEFVSGMNVGLVWVLMGVGELVLLSTTIVVLAGCISLHCRELALPSA